MERIELAKMTESPDKSTKTEKRSSAMLPLPGSDKEAS